MTRSELIARLAERHSQLIKSDTELAVALILESITTTLKQGDRVEIRGFGSFSLSYRPSRVGRNPKTGERLVVPAKCIPHFKPGKELSLRVNQARSSSEPLRLAA